MKQLYINHQYLVAAPILQFAVTILLCLLPLQTVNSAIHACKLADGSTVFQDTACAVIPVAKEKPVAKAAAIPFGIEESWFEPPPVIPDRAVCTEAGCHCGMHSREHKNGLPLAIADALYLDGSWHRLDSTLMEIEDPNKNNVELAELRLERDEAACNILMSQKTLRLFGKEVLREMRRKKRYAEDLGLDNPEDCDAGDMEVCTHTDSIVLYKRILTDIKALGRRARGDDELSAIVDPTLGAAMDDVDIEASLGIDDEPTEVMDLPFNF